MTVPVDLDEQYLLADQDVDVPVWPNDDVIDNMQRVDDPNDQYDTRQPVASIRTASGVLDFLDGVRETALKDVLPKAAESPRKKPKLDTIRTRELGAPKWRGGNRQVTAVPYKLLEQSDQRRKVTIVNRGSAPAVGTQHVYVSSVSSSANAPNTYCLQFNAFYFNPLVLETTDDIWVVCVAGETSVVDFHEEFDMED